MVNLNTRLLADLLIAWPPIEEQRRMLAVLDAHEARIRSEQTCRDKLKLLKKGLTGDLLTGRVQVSV
jgi:type I restriction enzyme S subunit